VCRCQPSIACGNAGRAYNSERPDRALPYTPSTRMRVRAAQRACVSLTCVRRVLKHKEECHHVEDVPGVLDNRATQAR
jgi:hypothetical protein